MMESLANPSGAPDRLQNSQSVGCVEILIGRHGPDGIFAVSGPSTAQISFLSERTASQSPKTCMTWTRMTRAMTVTTMTSVW